MKELTDTVIRHLPKPEKGMVIVRDSKVRGLGVRVLPSGTKAFVLDYHAAGRRRVYTIGKTSEWTVKAARDHATELKFRIRKDGANPSQDLKESREGDTVEDLCKDFIEHELPALRPSTRSDYTRMINKDIIPAIGKLKVAAVKHNDIDGIFKSIKKRGSPVAAQGCVVLCRRLFNMARTKGLTTDRNPTEGIKTPPSNKVQRYLKDHEIAGLTKALDVYADQDVADIFRVLLFTGARRGEAQSATWDQMDLKKAGGVWTKPSSHTKQKKLHHVPLSPAVRALLVKRSAHRDVEIKNLENEIAKAKPTDRDVLKERLRRVETFVFPAMIGDRGHISSIKKAWASLCKTSGIKGARIHDLRHTAASILASKGASLLMIGELLGHTQTSTTQRYAHLVDGVQRATANLLGAAITKAAKGK